MPNPLVSGGVGPNSATAPSNPVNGTYPTTLRDKTNFPINLHVLATNRFGEISPIYAFECVPDDDISLSMDNRLDSYTLSSPLLSQLRRHTAHVAVPKQAIYFYNWSRLFVDPKKGDDVIPSDVRALIDIRSLLLRIVQYIVKKPGNADVASWCGLAFILYMISPSSLVSRLRVWQPNIKDFCNSIYTSILDVFKSGDEAYPDRAIMKVSSVSGTTSHTYDFTKLEDFRAFLDDCLFYGPVSISYITFGNSTTSDIDSTPFLQALSACIPESFLNLAVDYPVNIEHVIAYQLSCCQFFTNSDVDYVYTSELYMRNMESLESLCGLTPGYYSWNGIRILYDWCSATNLSAVSGCFNSQPLYALTFFINLFCIQRSLMYGDMANSCYVEPLAVGEASASVDGSVIGQLSVSAVDTTISILKQRYLHLVNSAPSTIQSYSLAVFGVVPDVLPAEPRFISHHVDNINDVVNVNVSGTDTQGTQNANLMSRSSQREFVSHFNQETIIITCEWFDCIFSYPNSLSPFALKKDRFDYYIPQLQNIGMQQVPVCLFDASADPESIYGYLPNDYEYKQAISISCGAFNTGYLPSWAFLRNDVGPFINPYTIRHRPVEFDRFYKSLSGFGANYFHFIQSHVLHYNSSRPMEFAPGVLMRS